MIQRLVRIPVPQSATIYLRFVMGAVLGFVFLGNNSGYFGAVNIWLLAHIPLWGAAAVAILMALFPALLFLFPRGSVAHFLVEAMAIPLLFVLLPSLKELPIYAAWLILPGFLYFMIRWSYFYESIPKLEQPIKLDRINPPRSFFANTEHFARRLLLGANVCLLLYLFGSKQWGSPQVPLWLSILDIVMAIFDFSALIILRWESTALGFLFGLLAGGILEAAIHSIRASSC